MSSICLYLKNLFIFLTYTQAMIYVQVPSPSSGLVLTVGEVTRCENPLSPNMATMFPFQGWSAVISGMNMAEVIPS